jgi:superfamily II DNA or RNA helicase
MKLKPRDYQTDAIKSICSTLTNHDRALAVMACGTGKTLVALWVAEQLQAKTILVLMPSLMLIKQTIATWSAHIKWQQYKFMAVCSDNTAADDDITLERNDSCYAIGTDGELVNRFISEHPDTVRLLFATYQSAAIIPNTIHIDLAIFDEAHKIAHDNSHFLYALYDKNIPIKKRLFFTATPRHYSLRYTHEKLEYSMDNAELYGPLAYNLTFGDAIKLGIICDYKIIITVIDKSKLDDRSLEDSFVNINKKNKSLKVNAKTMAAIIALNKCYSEYQINRSITFHRSIADARAFTRAAETATKHIKALHVNGGMSSDARTKVMNEFKNKKLASISNARCLTEGVDIPSVDLVAFLSPKQSKIDIIQAAGRAMRNSPGKQCGYILLPLYIDNLTITNVDNIGKNNEFKQLIDILNSLREYDVSLHEYINDIVNKRNAHNKKQENKVKFIASSVNTDELIESISIKIFDQFRTEWNDRYDELKKYIVATGSFFIKKYSEHETLRRWICTQRCDYNKNLLSHDKIANLAAINFPFDLRHEKFLRQIDKFKEFLNKNPITSLEKKSIPLTIWYYKMRKKFHANTLRPEQKEIFERVCAEYNTEPTNPATRSEIRSNNIAELVKFHHKHGSCASLYTLNRKLFDYFNHKDLDFFTASEQLILKKMDTPLRFAKSIMNKWKLQCAKLEKYKEENNSIAVPPSMNALYQWISLQKRKWRNNELSDEQIMVLKEIGLTPESRINYNGKKI